MMIVRQGKDWSSLAELPGRARARRPSWSIEVMDEAIADIGLQIVDCGIEGFRN